MLEDHHFRLALTNFETGSNGPILAVYVDDAIWPLAGRKWCHMLADDIDELHRFAAQLGVKRLSYQGPPKTTKPHYDITAFERDRALRLGAIACTRDEIVQVLRRVRAAQAVADKA